MSNRIRYAGIRGGMLALGLTVLLSPGVGAAEPATRSPAGASVRQETTKIPAPHPPSPAPPAVAPRPVALTPQMPLREAIDRLRASTTPPLTIIVLWRPLADGAGIYPETPIGIGGAAELRAGQWLDLLIASLSAGAWAKVGYIVDHGVITIATIDTLPAAKPITRVYDISDLAAVPARYSLSSMGFGPAYGGPVPLGGVGGPYGAGNVRSPRPPTITPRSIRLPPPTSRSRYPSARAARPASSP